MSPDSSAPCLTSPLSSCCRRTASRPTVRHSSAPWRPGESVPHCGDRATARCERGEAHMQGTMLWFNADKGHGFIRTEDDERLYVARAGFATDHEPQPRCKGRAVSFQ